MCRVNLNEIKKEYNEEIFKLLVKNEDNGKVHGRVCAVCDRLMGHRESALMAMKTFIPKASYLKDSSLPPHIQQHYTLKTPDLETSEALRESLLSPRTTLVYKSSNKRSRPHVMCCRDCKSGMNVTALKKGDLPRHSIANGWAIGDPPDCLKSLNEVELALISKARFRGHLFTYWGGCHRSIKGWHTFYDTNPAHAVAVLNTVQNVTENEDIAVILTGPFTTEQKTQVMKRIQVNVPRVTAAFKWLKENNPLHANETLPNLLPPTVIDQSYNVDSQDSDIEKNEQMTVVFPDGTVNTGGLDTGEEFEEAIARMRSEAPAVQPYLTSKPTANPLYDYEDDNLMKAFPLQFPYGIGLPKEFIGKRQSLASTLSHLLYLSQPAFHEACFVLVIHNMFERGRALNGAFWRVMGKQEKCDISEAELNIAINRKKKGLPPLPGAANNFLNSLHAVKRNLCHSNEAAMSARSQFMSLSHHFGCPQVLFTVTFDDALDLRILT